MSSVTENICQETFTEMLSKPAFETTAESFWHSTWIISESAVETWPLSGWRTSTLFRSCLTFCEPPARATGCSTCLLFMTWYPGALRMINGTMHATFLTTMQKWLTSRKSIQRYMHISVMEGFQCSWGRKTHLVEWSDSRGDSQSDDSDSGYYTVEKHCYDRLFDFIRNAVFEEPQVVKLSDLTSKLVGWLLELDVDDVKPSTKKHIRRKLGQEFGHCLHFVPDNNGKILLYPDNMSGQACERKPGAKRWVETTANEHRIH